MPGSPTPDPESPAAWHRAVRPLTPSQREVARGQWAPVSALTWMLWKSCCSSSQSRRQSPNGPGGVGCMAAGRSQASRGSRRPVHTGRVQGASASAASASAASGPGRFRARAAAASNENRAWSSERLAPPPPEPIRAGGGAGAGPSALGAARRATPGPDYGWGGGGGGSWLGSTGRANCVVQPAVPRPVMLEVN